MSTTQTPTVSFDAWNQRETLALIQDNPGMSRQIRSARTGGLARFVLWDDYLRASAEGGFTPEEKMFA